MKEEKTHHIEKKQWIFRLIFLSMNKKKNLSYFYIFLNKSYEEEEEVIEMKKSI